MSLIGLQARFADYFDTSRGISEKFVIACETDISATIHERPIVDCNRGLTVVFDAEDPGRDDDPHDTR
jgi:hypothetical protein